MSRSTTEESVGITEFLNKEEGFEGIIKHKYSDFQVHEILENGSVLKYTPEINKPEPENPPGFNKWLFSSAKTFTYTEKNDLQTSKIYYEHPEITITKVNGQVTLEKSDKRRTRQEVVAFTLYKENINQQEAISKIASKLGVKKSQIGISGNKDKRAITTQLVTVTDISLDKAIESLKRVDRISCSGFHRTMNPATLGDNRGNRFTIVIRDIKHSDPKLARNVIRSAVESIEKNGFINYVGMQRFGSGGTATHKVGIHVLRGELGKAVDAILRPYDGEEAALHAAKLEWERTKDPTAVLKLLPPSAAAERALMEAARETTDKTRMFNAIERRQRMLYVHAYQSYLWNKKVSERIKTTGLKVLKGDLVRTADGARPIGKKSLSKTHISAVVLPLPHATAREYLPLLKADGVTLEMLERAKRDYCVRPEYREIVALPTGVEWSVVRHSDVDVQLAPSDVDAAEGRNCKAAVDQGGRHLSLVLSFSLKAGQYATMLLRELMKRSTEWFGDEAASKALSK